MIAVNQIKEKDKHEIKMCTDACFVKVVQIMEYGQAKQ